MLLVVTFFDTDILVDPTSCRKWFVTEKSPFLQFSNPCPYIRSVTNTVYIHLGPDISILYHLNRGNVYGLDIQDLGYLEVLNVTPNS